MMRKMGEYARTSKKPRDSPTPIAHIIVNGICLGERHEAASRWHRENRLQPMRFNGIRVTRDTDDSVVLRIIEHDLGDRHNIS